MEIYDEMATTVNGVENSANRLHTLSIRFKEFTMYLSIAEMTVKPYNHIKNFNFYACAQKTVNIRAF